MNKIMIYTHNVNIYRNLSTSHSCCFYYYDVPVYNMHADSRHLTTDLNIQFKPLIYINFM